MPNMSHNGLWRWICCIVCYRQGPRADEAMTTTIRPRQQVESVGDAIKAKHFGTERAQGKLRGERKNSIRFESG